MNGTGVLGPCSITGSYQLLGSNKGDYSAAVTGGAEVGGNINVSGYGQFNLPAVYNLHYG